MKLVIIGFPENASDELFEDLTKFITNTTGFIPKVHVMTTEDLFSNPIEFMRVPSRVNIPSKLEQIVANLTNICGDPEDEITFRANFWPNILISKAITSPILEELSMAPRNKKDSAFLKRSKCEYLPQLAKSALITMM